MKGGIALRAWLAAGVAALALLAADVVLAASDIRHVRLWRAPDNTRLVFDLGGPVQHNVFTLSAPDRIVIDIDGAVLKTRLEPLLAVKTPIKGLRVAERGPGQLRIVLDMTAPVVPNSSLCLESFFSATSS